MHASKETISYIVLNVPCMESSHTNINPHVRCVRSEDVKDTSMPEYRIEIFEVGLWIW